MRNLTIIDPSWSLDETTPNEETADETNEPESTLITRPAGRFGYNYGGDLA